MPAKVFLTSKGRAEPSRMEPRREGQEESNGAAKERDSGWVEGRSF